MMKVSNIYFMKRFVRSTWITLRLKRIINPIFISDLSVFYRFQKNKKSLKSGFPNNSRENYSIDVEVNYGRIDLTVLQDSFLAMGNRFILTAVCFIQFLEKI